VIIDDGGVAMAEMSGAIDTGPHAGLEPHPGWDFPVLATRGLDAGTVNRLAGRTAAASRYLSGLFDHELRVALLVLGPEDWDSRSPNLVYGMPGYAQGNLFVAGTTNKFWEESLGLIKAGAPGHLPGLSAVYGAAGGGIDLTPFFDLLPVHELAHAFFNDGPRCLPRKWLNEFECNLLMHGYVAAEEPGQLPVLTTFPAAVAAIEPPGTGYRSLADFDTFAENMDPWNYGWYQCRLSVAAARVHDSAGAGAARRLSDTFLSRTAIADDEDLSDEELVRLLDQADPALGDVARHW
jgi:hypothetical protein